MLNSTDTPTGPDFQPQSGFGYVNLNTAWARRSNFETITLQGTPSTTTTTLHTLTLPGEPFRINALWNRHLTGLGFDGSGDPTFTTIVANALVLRLFEEATGTEYRGGQVPAGAGNVQQVAGDRTGQSAGPGVMSLSYSPWAQSGPSELVVLAFSSAQSMALTPAKGPVLAPSCTLPAAIAAGSQFQMTCSVANPGDLPAFGIEGSLLLGSGFSGNNAPTFGTVPAGQSSAPVAITLTAPTTAADYSLGIYTRSYAFGQTYTGTAGYPFDNSMTAHVIPPANAAPGMNGLCPGQATAGSNVKLTVMGSNFLSGATIYWNSTALTTTYANPNQLSAAVPASLLIGGTTANVSVVNPNTLATGTQGFTVNPQPPDQVGTIMTVAGGGQGCTAMINTVGDGGPATRASLKNPSGIVVDAAGDLFNSDYSHFRIRKVTPAGIISTYAGNGNEGYSGDGGLATSAMITPLILALDAVGNLYFADSESNRIRKVTPAGIISTYAGNGNAGYSGNGGPATSAELGSVYGLATDAKGNLYLAENSNLVRKVDADGIISAYAGSGNIGCSGDGGPASSAAMTYPGGLAVDSAGNLYIADAGCCRIRKVTPDGIISTYGGNGEFASTGDGGPATSAGIRIPETLAADAAGNLYVEGGATNQIRRISPDGIIAPFAGNGIEASTGDGGPATSASLASPGNLAANQSGDVYIVEGDTFLIRKVAAKGALHPVPFSNAVYPGWAVAGGTRFTLTVTGANFVSGTNVYWDSTLLATTYVSPTHLNASVPSSLFASAGSHMISVVNPAPGGGASNPIELDVRAPTNPQATITASPNPITAAGPNPEGNTTLAWSAPGYSAVEVHSLAPAGPLVITGGSTGSVAVSGINKFGSAFYLVDPAMQTALATVNVTLEVQSRAIGVPERPGRGRSPKSQSAGDLPGDRGTQPN